MTLNEALDKLLASYSRYYDINRETPKAPFLAEAVFHMHDEKYLLVKSAKVSESDTGDLIFFLETDDLTPAKVTELATLAWEEGLSRIDPHGNHRNTDINLYIFSDDIGAEAAQAVKKCRFYKSYRFGLHGYSHFKLIAYDLRNDRFVHNRMGGHLAKVVNNIFKEAKALR